MPFNLPKEPDWVVLDAPAGLQGYKLSDYLRVVDKVIVPVCRRCSIWRPRKIF